MSWQAEEQRRQCGGQNAGQHTYTTIAGIRHAFRTTWETTETQNLDRQAYKGHTYISPIRAPFTQDPKSDVAVRGSSTICWALPAVQPGGRVGIQCRRGPRVLQGGMLFLMGGGKEGKVGGGGQEEPV